MCPQTVQESGFSGYKYTRPYTEQDKARIRGINRFGGIGCVVIILIASFLYIITLNDLIDDLIGIRFSGYIVLGIAIVFALVQARNFIVTNTEFNKQDEEEDIVIINEGGIKYHNITKWWRNISEAKLYINPEFKSLRLAEKDRRKPAILIRQIDKFEESDELLNYITSKLSEAGITIEEKVK